MLYGSTKSQHQLENHFIWGMVLAYLKHHTQTTLKCSKKHLFCKITQEPIKECYLKNRIGSRKSFLKIVPCTFIFLGLASVQEGLC